MPNDTAAVALSNAYKFNKTFSGTDTLAFMMLPGCTPILLGALTTASYSVYRNKKPVINIGRTNINGVTRGSRIFAGTMIFTLINQHWLRELCDQPAIKPWLGQYNELKADELPLFDIMIISANEYGNWCEMFVYGIDITDEAQTVSVEDLFTENTLSFVARDISTFKMVDPLVSNAESQSSNGSTEQEPSIEIIDTENPSLENIDKIEEEFKNKQPSDNVTNNNIPEYNNLLRDLYYSSYDTIMGSDVAELQSKLNQLGYKIEVNGKFDAATDEAVRKYQSEKGLGEINGVVDNVLYNMILSDTIGEEDDKHMACVVNKSGAIIYQQPNLNSSVADTIPYKNVIEVFEIVPGVGDSEDKRFYKTINGYVLESDMYSFLSTGYGAVEFPTVSYGDSNAFVTLVQQILSEIYPNDNIHITGEYSDENAEMIKHIQADNGLDISGEVDNDTWQVLQNLSRAAIDNYLDDDYTIYSKTQPGIYRFPFPTFVHELDKFNNTIYSRIDLNVKISAITEYQDGQTELFSKMQTIESSYAGGFTIGFEQLQRAFLYHPEHGVPVKVELVLYPYNKKSLKWTIVFDDKGGV